MENIKCTVCPNCFHTGNKYKYILGRRQRILGKGEIEGLGELGKRGSWKTWVCGWVGMYWCVGMVTWVWFNI
jgi:hypothetical protein